MRASSQDPGRPTLGLLVAAGLIVLAGACAPAGAPTARATPAPALVSSPAPARTGTPEGSETPGHIASATLTPATAAATAIATATATATHFPGLRSGWATFAPAEFVLMEGRDLHAIAIAPDGDLWLGTDRGVYRFDGVEWEAITSSGLAHPNVLSLAVGPAGGIWAGTREGISRFDGEGWTTFSRKDYCLAAYCAEAAWIFALAVAPDGAIWFADTMDFNRFDGETWVEHRPPAGIEGPVGALAITPDGDTWFGTLDGAFYQSGQSLIAYTTADGLAADGVEAIVVAPDGALWFGTAEGVTRFDGERWTTFNTADGLPGNRVKDMTVAPDGALWFATEQGVARYMPEAASAGAAPVATATAIPSVTPSITATPTGTPSPLPATATPTPLPEILRPVVVLEDLLPGSFRGFTRSPKGEPWLITDEGIAKLAGATWAPVLTSLPGSFVGIDARDQVWVVSEDRSEISAWDGAAWTTYSADSGWAPANDVWYAYVRGGESDLSGRFWVTTSDGVRVLDSQRWTTFSREEMGMGEPEYEDMATGLRMMVAQSTGAIWLSGCWEGEPGGPGVRWFDGHAWQGADSPVATGCATVAREDSRGQIWLGVDELLWRYDPVSEMWKQFSPPEESLSGQARFGPVIDIALEPSGGLWVAVRLCGPASCDTNAVYRVEEGVWRLAAEQLDYPGLAGVVFDTDGTPWVFWEGEAYEMEGEVGQAMAGLMVRAVAVEGSGRVWFVARHGGDDILWTVDGEG